MFGLQLCALSFLVFVSEVERTERVFFFSSLYLPLFILWTRIWLCTDYTLPQLYVKEDLKQRRVQVPLPFYFYFLYSFSHFLMHSHHFRSAFCFVFFFSALSFNIASPHIFLDLRRQLRRLLVRNLRPIFHCFVFDALPSSLGIFVSMFGCEMCYIIILLFTKADNLIIYIKSEMWWSPPFFFIPYNTMNVDVMIDLQIRKCQHINKLHGRIENTCVNYKWTVFSVIK